MPNECAATSWFGSAVAISGNTAIVAGHESAYLFEISTGRQIATLTAADLLARTTAFSQAVESGKVVA